MFSEHTLFSRCVRPDARFIQLCSSLSCTYENIEYVSILINLELNTMANWLAMNKGSLNAISLPSKGLTENYIPRLVINIIIEQVTELFLGG